MSLPCWVSRPRHVSPSCMSMTSACATVPMPRSSSCTGRGRSIPARSWSLAPGFRRSRQPRAMTHRSTSACTSPSPRSGRAIAGAPSPLRAAARAFSTTTAICRADAGPCAPSSCRRRPRSRCGRRSIGPLRRASTPRTSTPTWAPRWCRSCSRSICASAASTSCRCCCPGTWRATWTVSTLARSIQHPIRARSPSSRKPASQLSTTSA